jgi:uncharacterized protein YegL
MRATVNNTLYEDVVGITYEYLGPAADRFVARQIRNHLGKEPEQLRRQDLKALIDWFSASLALLSEDTELVKKYVIALKALTGSRRT